MFTLYNTLLISSEEQNPPVQKNKYNALMIIAENNFRDEELLIPKKILEENNIKVIISSTTIQTVTGMLKAKIKPDILLNDVNASDYDAIIFVGGIGAKSYFDNETAHKIAKKAYKENKILAAICIAPNILANAGLLKGKKATCFDKDILIENGAIYQNKAVVKDGNIITANGPKAAYEFANFILKAILDKKK